MTDEEYSREYAAKKIYEDSLKKCPFCGGKGMIIGSAGCIWVECVSCGVETRSTKNIKTASNLWNARYGFK